jgi:hypothetical protein
VEEQYGIELVIAFRICFCATPSSATLESDFGIAGTIITPRKSNMRAVLFEMMLKMKVDKSHLPKPLQFLEIKEISHKNVKSTLSERFTGEAFAKTFMLQGVSKSGRTPDLDDISAGASERSCSDSDSEVAGGEDSD